MAKSSRAAMFGISHFAGNVYYNVKGEPDRFPLPGIFMLSTADLIGPWQSLHSIHFIWTSSLGFSH